MGDNEIEAWDDLLFGRGSGDEDWEPPTKTCKFCGMDGLHWLKLNELWRLHDVNNTVHQCLLNRDKV